MKRIVTAIGADGKSHIVSEGAPARVMTLGKLPNLEFAEVWGTEATPTMAPTSDITAVMGSLVPGPGGTRFRIVTLPPDRQLAAVLARPEDAMEMIAEFRAKAPGIADAGDLHDPAMHVTPTLDYGIVLAGEVVLEMDSGESVLMREGDCVVQQATKHAWRNRSDRPCTLAFVMVGASPIASGS